MEQIQTSEKFDEIIQSKQAVIIKFFANWCPDCKRLDMFIGPVMEEFQDYKWYEVNTDEIEGIAGKYEVMGIPSILIFENGEKIAHQHSAYTKTPESVTQFLQEHLKK